MRIRLSIAKSVHENAAVYYEKAKEIREKEKGVEKAIEETRKEMEKAKKEGEAAERKKREERKIARKKEWYEKFHYFFTSKSGGGAGGAEPEARNGKLVIGGKSAEQNDSIYRTYFEVGDLFFHADIQGGSACVLKDGVNASENELGEVAQFAACFSNAWKNGNAAVDVYCAGKEQVSKHIMGGFIGKGSFAIAGERMWFRKTELKLKLGIENGIVVVLPASCARKVANEVVVVPGTKEKGEIVKKLAKILSVHPDEVQNLLPAGRGAISKM